jgi:hypothetical protein
MSKAACQKKATCDEKAAAAIRTLDRLLAGDLLTTEEIWEAAALEDEFIGKVDRFLERNQARLSKDK